MTDKRQFLYSLGKLLLLALIPTLGLLAIRFLAEADFDWDIILQLGFFVIAILLAAFLCQPGINANARLQFHPPAIGLIIFTIITGIIYFQYENTLMGWLLIAGIYSLLLGWVFVLGSSLPIWKRLFLEGTFMAVAGVLPPLLNQIETRFSTEEFFVVLEVASLMVFWLLLRGMYALWMKKREQETHLAKFQIQRSWFLTGLGLIAFAGTIFTGLKYQSSFFPTDAPSFPGISSESPFICGEAPPSDEIYEGEEVFQNLLKQVSLNPNKNAPEFAFLALGTQDQKWAEEFRGSILAEADAGLFTEPAGSVKYGQYLASQRAFFYPLVRDAYPALFSHADEKIIQEWFSAINQRTFTVEWVDWMYALAFRYWPQGPYENQENGAGLLSLLELNELADPNLSDKNKQYLTDNQRGWLPRFRVTDDAAVYQPEWIENAWFQLLYSGKSQANNQLLSFDWLKLLSLPDGSPLKYNHPGAVEYANHAYWGASLLNDPTLLWLAGRALDAQEKNQSNLNGQVGAEKPLTFTGNSPTFGSCLLFGNSGLPTQEGPLAPDKLVFRSGWDVDDIYISLNLRFTGWHRYKATNSLMQIYQTEPLVIENTASETFNWLPSGRSLFRDKRIPRENLNGLQIAKSGFAAVLYQLTGIGSPWAQDPPYYAEVTHFETTPEFDRSTTIINDWHGWQHQRTVYFYPEGVIAILDNAQGPKGQPATLAWHLVGNTEPTGNRISLGLASETGTSPEIVLLPLKNEQVGIQPEILLDGLPGFQVKYQAPHTGHLQTVTVFLFDDWVEAQVGSDNQVITIQRGARQIEIRAL